MPCPGLFAYKTDPHYAGAAAVAVPFTLDRMAHVLGYEAETGDVGILRLNTQRSAEMVWSFRWSPGWTIQLPLLWRTP